MKLLKKFLSKAFLMSLLCTLLPGCASIKVNYGSMTNEKLQSKDPNAEILLLTKDLDQPYMEIGIISIVGADENTSYDELNDKLRQKAREIGADAVIKIEYGTETKNIMAPSSHGYGSIGGTILKPSCKGIAIVYK